MNQTVKQAFRKQWSILLAATGVIAITVVGVIANHGASAAAETSFTLVQVPDTQQEVLNDTNPLLRDRYNWIVNNQQALNVKFIAHTGDLVNWGNVDPAQFTRASQATNILDASGIPYGYAIGNHDTAAVAAGGSAAPGDTHANLRNTTAYNQTFPVSRFKNVGGTYEAGKVDNMYQTFSAGSVDWLVISLEMWPRQGALDWAKQVVASHPKHNVIISTHANIDNTGAKPTTGNYGDKNAVVMWDQLFSQYANIKMVLSGHYGDAPGAYYSEATGVNGNKVAQIMTAYHSSYQDQLRLLKIDTANGTISSSVYAPTSTNAAYPSGYITDQFSNFVTTGMNWVQPDTAPVPVPDPDPTPTPPPAPTNLLTNGGFEAATPVMKAYNTTNSVLAYATSPVRSGTKALKVTSKVTSANSAGFNYAPAISNVPAGARVTAQCYVTANLAAKYKARLRLTELTPAGGAITGNVAETVTSTGVQSPGWQLVSVSYTKQQAANTLTLSGYSNDLNSTNKGALTFDDCQLTTAN
jgi:hypothetical protein